MTLVLRNTIFEYVDDDGDRVRLLRDEGGNMIVVCIDARGTDGNLFESVSLNREAAYGLLGALTLSLAKTAVQS